MMGIMRGTHIRMTCHEEKMWRRRVVVRRVVKRRRMRMRRMRRSQGNRGLVIALRKR